MATLEPVCGLRGISSRGQVISASRKPRTNLALRGAERGASFASDSSILALLVGALPVTPSARLGPSISLAAARS